jgi:hypothetical protein
MGGISSCSYSGQGNPVIQFQPSSTASSFASYRQALESHSGQATDYPGLGDEAFTITMTAGVMGQTQVVAINLGARKGEWGVFASASNVPVEKLEVLVTDLFADLGA